MKHVLGKISFTESGGRYIASALCSCDTYFSGEGDTKKRAREVLMIAYYDHLEGR